MKICLATLLLCLTFSAGAEIIYDNTDNFLLKVNSTPFESGDQVQLSGDNRIISYFAFEYFATASIASHGGGARVRFYLNNGPAVTNAFAAPGTLLYDSGSFLLSSNSSIVEISGLNLYVPSDTLTWTVQFSGVLTNEKAGALFFDPPGVGSSGNFLWQREGSEWRMIPGTGDITNNLSARFEAQPALRVKDLQLSNNEVVVTASVFAGKSYDLEFKTSVEQEGWTSVEHSTVRATTDEVTLIDPSGATDVFRVYRVVERVSSTEP